MLGCWVLVQLTAAGALEPEAEQSLGESRSRAIDLVFSCLPACTAFGLLCSRSEAGGGRGPFYKDLSGRLSGMDRRAQMGRRDTF